MPLPDEVCGKCQGRGAINQMVWEFSEEWVPCPACEGTGMTRSTTREGTDG